MNYLSKKEVIQIINNRPEGTSPAGIVAVLRQKGYQLEGYETIAKKENDNLPKEKQKEKIGLVQSIVQSIAQPVLKTAATGASAVKGITGLAGAGIDYALGNKDLAKRQLQEAAKPVNVNAGYFGSANPVSSAKEAIGTGAELTGTFMPIGKAASLGSKIIQGGVASSLMGGGRAMQEGKNTQETIKQAFMQGLTGAATIGVMSGVATGVKNVAKKLPERLYNSALQVNKKMLAQGKSPAKMMIDKGHFGTMGSIIKTSENKIQELDKVIDTKLANSTRIIDAKIVKSEILKRLQSSFGQTHSKSELNEIISNLPLNALKKGKIHIAQVNALRVQLDKMVGKSYFMSDRQAPVIKEALGSATNSLRQLVQSNSDTGKEFYELSRYIKARDLALDAAAQADKYWGIGFKDLLFGTMAGIGTGGSWVAGTGVVAAEKMARSPFMKTGLAVGQNTINEFMKKLPTDGMGRVSRTAVLNALKELFAQK